MLLHDCWFLLYAVLLWHYTRRMVKIFAITSRGLEKVAADELNQVPGMAVQNLQYRRISGPFDGPLTDLLSLTTVDDVFVQAAEWDQIVPQRQALQQIEALSRRLNLHQPLKRILKDRSIRRQDQFSVTANFVGRRNYSADEIKAAAAAGISARYHWQYQANDEDSEINIRIFIEHEKAYVGLRIGAGPLHRRAYKQEHLPGSLKPTVAAALLRYGDVKPGQRLLDPFCGAGTILIEGTLQGAHAAGGDLNPAAVQAALTNSTLAGAAVDLNVWDARNLPVKSVAVDRIVTNLPWGRQITTAGPLDEFYRGLCIEIERVLAQPGKAVLLTSSPDLVRFDHMTLELEAEVSVFGQNPKVLVFSK